MVSISLWPSSLPITGRGLAECQGAGRETVTQIVQPNVIQPGPGPDDLPDTVEAAGAETPIPVVARKHPGAALSSWQRFQKPCSGRRQLDRAGTGLGVGEM